MRAIGTLSLLLLTLSWSQAYADEEMRPLAVSGAWIALEHLASMVSHPDVCILADPAAGIAFRADDDDTELRVIDRKWSLPADVKGTIVVNVGQFKKIIDVDSNTDTSIVATLEKDDISLLFTAMDKATSMSVAVGSAKPVVASLAGSTKATNAFRTCAGIRSSVPSAGSNPFSPS